MASDCDPDALSCFIPNCQFDGKVKKFTQDKYDKCHEALHVRKTLNLKFADVYLPSQMMVNTGYHSKCYNEVTVISKSQREKSEKVKPYRRRSGSSSRSDSPTRSSRRDSESSTTERAHEPVRDTVGHEPTERINELLARNPEGQHELEDRANNLVRDPEEQHEIADADDNDRNEQDLYDENNEGDGTDNGIDVGKCCFCGLVNKKVHNKLCRKSTSMAAKLKNDITQNAEKVNDQQMLDFLSSKAQNDPIHYHNICKLDYFKKLTLAPKARIDIDSMWHQNREIHAQVFDEICLLVSETVIKNGGMYLLKYLHTCYRESLEREYKAVFGDFDKIFSVQHLQRKLVNFFGAEIQIITHDDVKIVASKDRVHLPPGSLSGLFKDKRLQEMGLFIRKQIYSIKKRPLSDEITASEIIAGECDIPPDLISLTKWIICGEDPRTSQSENSDRKVKSMCFDMIHNATHGKIKTSKHMCLGVWLKDQTGSRKMVDVFNRFGHCCSYNVVEELETEATYTSTARSLVCPDDIQMSAEYFTCVAWDNFDRFVETSNGKNTLHDTVGIIYQNKFDSDSDKQDVLIQAINNLREELGDLNIDNMSNDNINNANNTNDNINNDDSMDLDLETSNINNSNASNLNTSSSNTSSSNTSNSDVSLEVSADEHGRHVPSAKKRRRFEGGSRDIDVYIGKPKLKATLIPLGDELRTFDDTSYKFAKKLDYSWLISHYLGVPKTPMWVGFNSKIVIDNSISQRVSYLTPINQSPTNRSVVAETMNISQQVAKECKQEEIQVTYDLAIAKIAFQIKDTEEKKIPLPRQIKPKYHNVFIHLGEFHIQLSYEKGKGKFVDECGLTHMMVESDLLASGSVNGFISGKHFNRCKKLHPIAALAIQKLHFESFLKHEKIELSNNVKSLVNNLQKFKVDGNFFDRPQNQELDALLDKYDAYVDRTLKGDFGYTPQYYMMYVGLVNNSNTFSRSIRTGDFELYKFIIYKLCDLLFVFNLVNYCRWLLWYLDQLLKAPQDHPFIALQMKRGYFGVKRTNKPFSKSPPDLVLEQTYNKQAGRRQGGVMCFTNSIYARQRWSKSQCFRSTIGSHVLNECGIAKSQDTTKELEWNSIRNSTAKVKKLVETIKNNLNPFDPDLDKNSLYNISTGKPVSSEIASFLLNVNNLGSQLKNKFIEECSSSPDRFESRITLTKYLNFASSNKKQTVNVSNQVKAIKMQRDLFGRILAISKKHEPDIPKILSYPLTPLPNCFCHLDGTIHTTQKSKLFHSLIGLETHDTTELSCDVMIVDGFFYLRTLQISDFTYAKISKNLLSKLIKLPAKEIHLVFDQYISPSIKDYERNKRGASSDRAYIITADMVLTNAFSAELRNTNFKQALIQFFIEHWLLEEMVPFFQNKTVFINYDRCYEYKVIDNKLFRSINPFYNAPRHEEADTRIVHVVCNYYADAKVTIKCDDTDILIILLGNMHKLRRKLEINLLFGVSDHARLISVNSLYEELGEQLCKALPAFHAFTGCDYNPSFHRKAKVKPLAILGNSEEYQRAFADMSNESSDKSIIFPIIEKYVCAMYSQPKKVIDVNSARYAIYKKKFEAKSTTEKFEVLCTKNIDPKMMPPCKTELWQQFLRSHYIATLWGNANEKIPTEMKPDECGWKKENETYDFVWFEGLQWPEQIKDVIINEVAERDEPAVDPENGNDDDDNISEADSDCDESDADEEYQSDESE